MPLPTDPKERKRTPVYSGVVKYFPDALVAVAQVSQAGNDQHNPGEPLRWAKHKSTDHADCIMRHLIDHTAGAPLDVDGQRHLAKLAWRALALLQTAIEAEGAVPLAPLDEGVTDLRAFQRAIAVEDDDELWGKVVRFGRVAC